MSQIYQNIKRRDQEFYYYHSITFFNLLLNIDSSNPDILPDVPCIIL